MNNSQNNDQSLQKPLRLWPGVVLAIVLLVSNYLVAILLPEYMFYGLFVSLGAAVAIILWWLFFSRTPWSERLGALAVMALALFATYQFLHISIAKGAMGMLFWILSIPLLTVAFVAWAVLTRRLSNPVRRVTMVLTIFLACGFWILIRTGGFSGQGENDFAWRWSPTPEDRLLAQEKTIPTPPPSAATPAPQPGVQPQTTEQTAETPSTATEGVQQVLMMNNPGAISVVPATGKLLWKHELPKGTRIVQPAITAEGDLLLTDGDAHGLRRVAVDRESSGWTVKERWSTIGLKPSGCAGALPFT